MCVFICVYIYIIIYVCVFTCVYIYVYVSEFTYAYTYVYVFICVCMYIYTYVYMYVCIYIYHILPTNLLTLTSHSPTWQPSPGWPRLLLSHHLDEPLSLQGPQPTRCHSTQLPSSIGPASLLFELEREGGKEGRRALLSFDVCPYFLLISHCYFLHFI